MGFGSRVGDGLKDLFYEPAMVITKGPEEFQGKLRQGALSMSKNAVYAPMDAISKMTGAVSKGLKTLAMDDDQDPKRKKKASGVGAGLKMGAQEFGQGLFGGVTGVFTKPVQGAKEDGVGGFFMGVGKGVVGLAVKPVAGVLDLASRASEGVKGETGLATTARQRIRKPRVLRHGRVQEYDKRLADGNACLVEVNDGKYANESFHDCVSAAGCTIVLSNQALLCVQGDVNKPPSQRRLKVLWREGLRSITHIDGENERFFIVTRAGQRHGASAASEDERVKFVELVQKQL